MTSLEYIKEYTDDLCAAWEALGGDFEELREAIYSLIDPLLEPFRRLLEDIYGSYKVVSGRNRSPNKYKDIPLNRRGKENTRVAYGCNEKICRTLPYTRRVY